MDAKFPLDDEPTTTRIRRHDHRIDLLGPVERREGDAARAETPKLVVPSAFPFGLSGSTPFLQGHRRGAGPPARGGHTEEAALAVRRLNRMNSFRLLARTAPRSSCRRPSPWSRSRSGS